jgi:hypothetical protein
MKSKRPHPPAPRKKRKLEIGFHVTLKSSVPREDVAALPITDKVELAYAVLGGVADQLADFGIDPDLVAGAAWDLGHELTRIDGSPPRVFRLNPRREARDG